VRVCSEVWGQSQWDPAAKPLVRGSGAKPPEAGGILISHAKNKIGTEKINSCKS